MFELATAMGMQVDEAILLPLVLRRLAAKLQCPLQQAVYAIREDTELQRWVVLTAREILAGRIIP